MDLYFFKEGYLRTSSTPYSLTNDNIDDKFVHLTNNAVQKYASNYGEFEKGNQLSFKQFQKYLNDTGFDLDFQKITYPKMKEQVLVSMSSVKKSINI
mmetsp:Transcript_27603/g.24282  ORF Transcript_27603/g.24282 Transcript_27603/m.24282 type:complete len:97 (-) Transcript_27603:957-1247(-)